MCRGCRCAGARSTGARAGSRAGGVSRILSLRLSSRVYVSVACFCDFMSLENMSLWHVSLTEILTASDNFSISANNTEQLSSSGKVSKCWWQSGQDRSALYISRKSFLIPRMVLDRKPNKVEMSSLLNRGLFK